MPSVKAAHGAQGQVPDEVALDPALSGRWRRSALWSEALWVLKTLSQGTVGSAVPRPGALWVAHPGALWVVLSCARRRRWWLVTVLARLW